MKPMPADVFFDSNVLLYSVHRHEPKADRVEELLAVGGRISVQVLNEFATVCRYKYKLNWEEIDKRLRTIQALCSPPSSITLQMHEHALLVAKRYQFRFYDCLIIASALAAGCKTLYSEDMQHNQLINGLRIVNPFLDLKHT